MKIYFTYVLLSKKDGHFYTGFTENIKERLEEHNAGRVKSTASRIPLTLIYFEGCLNQKDASKREKYLKTTYGKRYIRNRIKNYLTYSTG